MLELFFHYFFFVFWALYWREAVQNSASGFGVMTSAAIVDVGYVGLKYILNFDMLVVDFLAL
jgi:hypothetical protein